MGVISWVMALAFGAGTTVMLVFLCGWIYMNPLPPAAEDSQFHAHLTRSEELRAKLEGGTLKEGSRAHARALKTLRKELKQLKREVAQMAAATKDA